jgi:hypothetical protein
MEAVEVLLEHAPGETGPVARRAAETMTRFAGMFKLRPDPTVLTRLRSLASSPDTGDVLAQSATADEHTDDLVAGGEVASAAALARSRVLLLLHEPMMPAAGLELKDALHMAVLTHVGARQLDHARKYAETQLGLPFLREHRDLAVDEMLLPLALADDDAVVPMATSFQDDWEAAGSPIAPGRAIGPAAVAYFYGHRGNQPARETWLEVTARVRGVPTPLATEATGYGEVFDAALALHRGRRLEAARLLERVPPDSWYGSLFAYWRADLIAHLNAPIS